MEEKGKCVSANTKRTFYFLQGGMWTISQYIAVAGGETPGKNLSTKHGSIGGRGEAFSRSGFDLWCKFSLKLGPQPNLVLSFRPERCPSYPGDSFQTLALSTLYDFSRVRTDEAQPKMRSRTQTSHRRALLSTPSPFVSRGV